MNAPGMQTGVHYEATETAIPTLKVMRLQKPELHTPAAGSIESKFMLSSAMCLPDSFGVIHVGETFTAYLGALNVSKTLNVTRLTVTAQLQTPKGRWQLSSSLDAGNANGGVEVPPESGIDCIVSHHLEEAGQHILRVEVGYGSREGLKTLRKFYRFQVSSPLIINDLTYRIGRSSCFTEITLENNGSETKGGLTICSVDFEAASGLEAEKVEGGQPKTGKKLSAVELFDQCGLLDAGSSRKYIFKVTASSQPAKQRGIAAGDELGKAVFTWRKACGEMGRLTSHVFICPNIDPFLDTRDPRVPNDSFVVYKNEGSALSVDVATSAASKLSKPTSDQAATIDDVLPVTVEPVDPPTKVSLGEPFQVDFLVVNHSNNYMTLQLQFVLDQMNGLSVCGPSYKNLEEVSGKGGSITVSIRFIALSAGLLQLSGCSVADLATGIVIPQPPLLNMLVDSEIKQ